MPHYTLFFFLRSSLTYHNFFTVFRAQTLMTEVALELTEKGCEGQVRIHATHCSAISFQIPIPSQFLVKYFSVAN